MIPVLEENFEVVELDDNFMSSTYLGIDFPFMGEKRLVVFLKFNVDLFVVSPDKMPDIDSRVA